MDHQSEKCSDGSHAPWPKVVKGDSVSRSTKICKDKDGSNGTAGSMASVDGSENKTISKKDKELLLKAGKFRDASIKKFIVKAGEKYDKGQKEHGGYLPIEVSLTDIEDEVIDLWFYVQALGVKLKSITPENTDILFHKR